jgi:hypothetical protein
MQGRYRKGLKPNFKGWKPQRRRSRSAAVIWRNFASKSARLRRTSAFWALVRKRRLALRQPVAPQSETRVIGGLEGCLAMRR